MTSDPETSLSRTLAAWQVTPAVDSQFRPAVWQRIQRRTRLTWAMYVRDHLVGWSVAASLTVLVAGWAGHSVAQSKLEASRDEMVVSYLGELDPRVMAKMPH